eukprot:93148-Pyramimonas_sp.AAC.1
MDDLKLHIAGYLTQYQTLRGLMMRLGKQDQAGQHHDWAWCGESGEVDDNTEGDDWYDAYEEN